MNERDHEALLRSTLKELDALRRNDQVLGRISIAFASRGLGRPGDSLDRCVDQALEELAALRRGDREKLTVCNAIAEERARCAKIARDRADYARKRRLHHDGQYIGEWIAMEIEKGT